MCVCVLSHLYCRAYRNSASLCWRSVCVWQMRCRKIQLTCSWQQSWDVLTQTCQISSEMNLFTFITYWFGVINWGLSSELQLHSSVIHQPPFFNQLQKYNKGKSLFPSEKEDYQSSWSRGNSPGQRGGVTFRHIGEGLVPHRQQRQQVEEERHQGSHQQTTPAYRSTHESIQTQRVDHHSIDPGRTTIGPGADQYRTRNGPLL